MNAEKRSIIREIERLHARRESLNITAVKRNHPDLIKRVYRVRPFWGWKRALEDAGLDYSTINTELLDYVDCKICGQDFGALAYHLISQHQVTAEEYREEYPGAEVVCEIIRVGIAHRRQRHRPPIPHWEDIWTPEYALDRMAELHRQRFPMNWQWVKDNESALSDKAISYFGSWDKARRHIGLDPRRIRLFRPTWRGVSPWRRAEKPAIVAELRRRSSADEPLSWKKIVREEFGPALLNRAVKLYGSWSCALSAAGLDPFNGARSPWGDADAADILCEIKRRKRMGASLRYHKVASEKWGQPLLNQGTALFGSWGEALSAVGIEPQGGRTLWADASKATILAELRRRKRFGASLRASHVAKEKHGRALRDRVAALFGTWTAALHTAGIEPIKEDSPWKHGSRTAILAEIRRRDGAGEIARDNTGGANEMGRAVN